MWIVVPLIFFMSWRSCRSVGQAFSETAAWAAGYLGTAGIIVLANWGNVDLIQDRPDSPGAAMAILGGFVGMGISRYLWKRRGGHLKRNPNRWAQAVSRSYKAMRTSPKPAERPVAAPRPATRSNPATSSTGHGSAPVRSRGATESVARELGHSPTVRKAMGNRWVRGSVRAVGAMFSDPTSKKRPRR